jgi:hypothetical protein
MCSTYITCNVNVIDEAVFRLSRETHNQDYLGSLPELVAGRIIKIKKRKNGNLPLPLE